MKISIVFLFILASILSACVPQVTVTSEVTVTSTPLPTETPIPTSTLHPQIIEIQEQIAASGDRFTLQTDGTIQDGTEIIPGLTVAPNGKIALTVNGETVTLDPADITFDDENGISIEGYKMDENGEWVTTELSPEDQLIADMDEWGLSFDNYDRGYDADGNIELRDKSGLLVYWNGRWATKQIVKMVKEDVMSNQACDAIKYAPAATGANYVSEDNESGFSEYRGGLIVEFLDLMDIDPSIKIRLMMEYPGQDKNDLHCWGIHLETVYPDSPMDTNFAYRDDKQEFHVYPVFYSQDHK